MTRPDPQPRQLIALLAARLPARSWGPEHALLARAAAAADTGHPAWRRPARQAAARAAVLADPATRHIASTLWAAAQEPPDTGQTP